jgi:hypothetical protein
MKLIVPDGNGWGGEILPHGELVGVEEPQDVGVGHHRLLLQVAHKPKQNSSPEAGVLVRKLSPLIQLSCELAGCVHQPIVDSESTIAG